MKQELSDVHTLHLSDMDNETADIAPLNNGASVWVAVFFLSVAYLMYNALPVILGAAADAMGLNDVQIGYLGSSYMWGAVFVGISSIYWIRKVNMRWVVLGSFSRILRRAGLLFNSGLRQLQHTADCFFWRGLCQWRDCFLRTDLLW